MIHFKSLYIFGPLGDPKLGPCFWTIFSEYKIVFWIHFSLGSVYILLHYRWRLFFSGTILYFIIFFIKFNSVSFGWFLFSVCLLHRVHYLNEDMWNNHRWTIGFIHLFQLSIYQLSYNEKEVFNKIFSRLKPKFQFHKLAPKWRF